MKWLYITAAHHAHAQNVGLALHEHDALGAWHSGWVFRGAGANGEEPWRRRIEARTIRTVPGVLVHPHPRWEMIRFVARSIGLGATVEDLAWERGEHHLDRLGGRLVGADFDGILGFEHGCLASLKEARRFGKRTAVIFASVHHSMRERWVDPEYRKRPDWVDASEEILLRRAVERDKRRDEEAHLADVVFGNSEFTGHSLTEGGIGPEKIRAIPLGLPSVVPAESGRKPGELRVLYAGGVALHKGFHYLQEAFDQLDRRHFRLDVFGPVRVRREKLSHSGNICFHGAVPPGRLAEAWLESDVLVFPTLCDGFGQVVGQALAHGLPVICSENAGAVEFIRDGENGFRVRPADAEAIRECLQRCLDDRSRLDAMREGARATGARWSWADFRSRWFEALGGVG